MSKQGHKTLLAHSRQTMTLRMSGLSNFSSKFYSIFKHSGGNLMSHWTYFYDILRESKILFILCTPFQAILKFIFTNILQYINPVFTM